MRVLRVYHGGRDFAQRERERALVQAGVDLVLVVPTAWPGSCTHLTEAFEVLEAPVLRVGDVNRHRFADPSMVTDLITSFRPDVLDLHEEPFSSVVHQMLTRVRMAQPVVVYTAQNIDKRFPPPFARRERNALARVQGIYPCTRQAASVVGGKGFTGAVRVLPLAPSAQITVGDQHPPTAEIRLLLVGRLVPGKGVLDAVRVVAQVRRHCPARLLIVGAGPEADAARKLAEELGVSTLIDIRPWVGTVELAGHYRDAHIVLAPSRSTRTWVEQFGRMVGEAHAAGAVVVGYASGSLPEVTGEAGILVAEGDAPALARAVLDLQRNPERWLALRDLGLTLAAGRTWARVATGQIELYEAAAQAAPEPRRLRPRRASAVLEYGDPAHVAGGDRRPFALPVLREDNCATRLLAGTLDLAGPREQLPRSGRRKVVYINHIAQLSGGELALVRLIPALPQFDAHVILGEEGPLRGALEQAGATVEVLVLNPRLRDTRRGEVATGAGSIRSAVLTVGYTLRLARRLRALQPDLVHTNSLKAGFYGCLSARLARRTVIWHVRDRIADDYLPPRVVRLTQFVLRHLPDYVVCNSAETLRTTGLAARESVPRRLWPARLKGWGVIGGVTNSTERGDENPVDRRTGIHIGMVGRLAPWKGQDIFVRAFDRAFRELPDVGGRIIGSAMFGEQEYESSLHALIGELALDDRISFSGFTTEVESELSGLDVLVHASVIAEPFGQVVLEGMAAGLPVVASAAGGPEEVITDQVDGLLTPPGSIEELASAMLRLVEEPDLRCRLGLAAVTRSRDFSPAAIGAQWQRFYDAAGAERRT